MDENRVRKRCRLPGPLTLWFGEATMMAVASVDGEQGSAATGTDDREGTGGTGTRPDGGDTTQPGPTPQPRPAVRPGLAVVITGGTRGIGAGIARAFLEAGSRVMVCGRTAPAEPSLLPAAGGRNAVFCQADVREPDQASRLIRTAADLFGRVDVVISNAGGSPEVAASAVSPRFLQKIIELNLTAPLLVAQSANAVMQAQDSGGVILMIGSVSGTRPSPGTAAYGAAKAGLHHLVTSLAIEWAPKVRIACVAPGFVATAAAAGPGHYGDGDGTDAVARSVPLQRMGTPQDVAAACVFLASPHASYISGTTLTLHGGGEPPAFLATARTA